MKELSECKCDAKNKQFWKRIELPGDADDLCVCDRSFERTEA